MLSKSRWKLRWRPEKRSILNKNDDYYRKNRLNKLIFLYSCSSCWFLRCSLVASQRLFSVLSLSFFFYLDTNFYSFENLKHV
jgi:hypothetical protein